MKNTLPILLTIIAFISCNTNETSVSSSSHTLGKEGIKTMFPYHLEEDGNVWVEIFDSTITDENRYTVNNNIFRAGRQFVYSYYHVSTEGDKFLLEDDPEINNGESEWSFVPIDEKRETTISKVVIGVKPGLFYNQTIIEFAYPTEKGRALFNSSSGVIENEKNIWMHPPRNNYFIILELNPFPFIKTPYKVGNRWEWSLKIGGVWEDEKWQTSEETIENKYQYEITAEKIVDTAFGELKCYEITAEAKSELGQTELISLFHHEYGFVRLDYTNIDGSKTVLELVEFARNGSKTLLHQR